MQGGALAMVAYGIGILPLINYWRRGIMTSLSLSTLTMRGPSVHTTTSSYILITKKSVPGRGYCPEPSKSVMIVHPDNLETVKWFGLRHGFKFCTGVHYLGCFIRYYGSKRDWLQDCTLKWEKNIYTISETAGKYPQEIYAEVVRAIQSEWIFLQCVTKNIGYMFAGVEKLLQETFLSRLFFGK